MIQLISKVQYKRSEKGEFHDGAERTLDDTITLILDYPWNTERNLASIELTCPSVTIEHPIGTYLKVGPYFSGKFSLYYLDTNHKVYFHTVNTLEEVCTWVESYYEQDGQLLEFEKYNFKINPSAHFQTNPFEYTINTKGISCFFIFLLCMIPLTLIMGLLKSVDRPGGYNFIAGLGAISFILLLCSPTIYLFFNYLSVDRNHYLQISKGHDEFVFGNLDNHKLYHKSDIADIDVYGTNRYPPEKRRYNKRAWSDCEVFIITFKNGEQIRFTSLLISTSKLTYKLPDHRFTNHQKFIPTVESAILDFSAST